MPQLPKKNKVYKDVKPLSYIPGVPIQRISPNWIIVDAAVHQDYVQEPRNPKKVGSQGPEAGTEGDNEPR